MLQLEPCLTFWMCKNQLGRWSKLSIMKWTFGCVGQLSKFLFVWVWKPIGSMIQVGSLVSSHFTPPAVLSSPMNLDLTQIKIIIIVFTIFTILNRDNKVIIFLTTLPYNICTNQLIVCINNIDNTICVKSALKSPCVWEFLPQPPNQGLLHLWCLRQTNFIPKSITVGQNSKYSV